MDFVIFNDEISAIKILKDQKIFKKLENKIKYI